MTLTDKAFPLPAYYMWASFLLLHVWKFLMIPQFIHCSSGDVTVMTLDTAMGRICPFPRIHISTNKLELHRCHCSCCDFHWHLQPCPFINVVFWPAYTSCLILFLLILSLPVNNLIICGWMHINVYIYSHGSVWYSTHRNDGRAALAPWRMSCYTWQHIGSGGD